MKSKKIRRKVGYLGMFRLVCFVLWCVLDATN